MVGVKVSVHERGLWNSLILVQISNHRSEYNRLHVSYVI